MLASCGDDGKVKMYVVIRTPPTSPSLSLHWFAPLQTANDDIAGQTKSGAKSCGPCTGSGGSRTTSTAGELMTRPRKAKRRSRKARPRRGLCPRDAFLSTLPTAITRSFSAPGLSSSSMPSTLAPHFTVWTVSRAASLSTLSRRRPGHRIDEEYGGVTSTSFFFFSWIQIMTSFAHGYGGRVSGACQRARYGLAGEMGGTHERKGGLGTSFRTKVGTGPDDT